MQVALVLLFMIYVFDVPARGPIFWIIVLTLIQGICGMSFGLVISALCDNEQDAIQVLLSANVSEQLVITSKLYLKDGINK